MPKRSVPCGSRPEARHPAPPFHDCLLQGLPPARARLHAGSARWLVALLGSLAGSCSPGEEGGPEVTVERPSATPNLPPAIGGAPALREPTANDLRLVE